MGANKTLQFQSLSLSFSFGVQIYCELKCFFFFYESIFYYMSHCPLWLNLFSLTTNYSLLITSWPQMIGLALNSNIFPPVTFCPCRRLCVSTWMFCCCSSDCSTAIEQHWYREPDTVPWLCLNQSFLTIMTVFTSVFT